MIVATAELPAIDAPAVVSEDWTRTTFGHVTISARNTLAPRSFPAEEFDYYSIPAYQEGQRAVIERGSAILSQKIVVDPGTVLFGKLNPRVHKVWLVDGDSGRRKIASTEFIPLAPDQRKIDSEFLYYLCWTSYVLSAAQELVSGSTPSRQRVDVRAFLKLPIRVPPLSEQRAIARVLRTVQEAKCATEKVLAATRQFKQSLMRHLFTYGPVPINQAGRVELKETEFGRIPSHWNVTRFGDVVTITSGQVDPRIEPYLSMLHVGPENIEEGTGRIVNPRSCQELKLISGKYLFEPANVLYSKIRPYLRKAALPCFQGVCSADMYPLYPKGELSRDYLYSWLLSEGFTRQAVSYQIRTGIPKINRQQLDSTWMAVPPAEEQERIANCLLACDRKAEKELLRVKALETLFQTLLHNLMTGRVRVKNLVSET